jgi:hypothetical protein
MKVAYLTAGAGGMYCGSCLRDNTLAAALIRQGRDVVLIPIYSPIRTDEPDVSTPAVYYGGINVYLQHRSALFRLLPRAFDRILDAPGLLRRALRNAGSAPPELAGPLTLSILRGEAGPSARSSTASSTPSTGSGPMSSTSPMPSLSAWPGPSSGASAPPWSAR